MRRRRDDLVGFADLVDQFQAQRMAEFHNRFSGGTMSSWGGEAAREMRPITAPDSGAWRLAIWDGTGKPQEIDVHGLVFEVSQEHGDPGFTARFSAHVGQAASKELADLLTYAMGRRAHVDPQARAASTMKLVDVPDLLAKWGIMEGHRRWWVVGGDTRIVEPHRCPITHRPALSYDDAADAPDFGQFVPTEQQLRDEREWNEEPDALGTELRKLEAYTQIRYATPDGFLDFATARGLSKPVTVDRRCVPGADRVLMYERLYVAAVFADHVRIGRLRPDLNL